MNHTKGYWLYEDSKNVVDHLEQYHQSWSVWDHSPFRQAWLRNVVAYYSAVVAPGSWDSSLIFEGVQGELVRMYTPKARTLIRQLVNIVTKQRISIQAIADSSQSLVIEDLKLANALAPQIVEDTRLDEKSANLTEGALVCGAGFTKATWRTDKGNRYSRDDIGNPVFNGAVDITVHTVFDVFYDICYTDWENLPWVEVRVIRNRWDMIAQFPELERELMAIPSISQMGGPNLWVDRIDINDDSIYCYELYVRPSPSLEEGRMLFYADHRCVFHDGPNVYGTLPVEPMIPEPVMIAGLGYPQFTNIMACQEMFDNSLSAIATNQSQYAVQSVSIPRGSGINVSEVNGMRVVSFTPQNVPGGGEPKALQLTQSAPETFKFAELLDLQMESLSGVTGALKGQPPPGVTSGVALATLSANAMEFTQSISKSLYMCLEKTISHALNAYKLFAKVDHHVRLKGQGGQMTQEAFTGERLQAIVGVKITLGNPLTQTISGRIEIADKILQMPKELWPKYVAILEGEPLQDLYKSDLSQNDLINSENEALIKGRQVPALMTDAHGLHVQQHSALLNDPTVRMNAPFIEVILNHLSEHLLLAQQQDPLLRAMIETGRIPEMAQQPMLGGPEAPGSIPGTPAMERAQPAEDALGRAVPQGAV